MMMVIISYISTSIPCIINYISKMINKPYKIMLAKTYICSNQIEWKLMSAIIINYEPEQKLLH